MLNDIENRFQRAYWRVVHQLDTVRLQHWERSQVTLPQLRVLFQLRRTPGITTRELSRLLGITVSTTSGLVIKLAERGLVKRTTTPEDRRREPLWLTDAGSALAGEFSDVTRPFLGRVAASLGNDLPGVTAALEQLADAAARVRAGNSADEMAGSNVPEAVP